MKTNHGTKEHELIHAARHGSLQAFNHLVEQYQDDVYAWLCWLFQDTRPADEATQRAFLHAFREISRFTNGSFRAWLLCLAARACQDAHRRTPSTAYSSPGTAQLFLQGLDRENQDTAFLVEVLRLSYAEASVVQGVTPEIIQQRVARIRLHTSERMRDYPSRAPAR
jgi:RNA polymerase sigma-70 factor (ECF subfamily)